MLAKDNFILTEVLLITNLPLHLPNSKLILKEFFCSCLQSLLFYRSWSVTFFQNASWYEYIVVDLYHFVAHRAITSVTLQQESIIVILVLLFSIEIREFNFSIDIVDCSLLACFIGSTLKHRAKTLETCLVTKISALFTVATCILDEIFL